MVIYGHLPWTHLCAPLPAWLTALVVTGSYVQLGTIRWLPSYGGLYLDVRAMPRAYRLELTKNCTLTELLERAQLDQ